MHPDHAKKKYAAAVLMALLFLSGYSCAAVRGQAEEKYAPELSTVMESAAETERIPVIIVLETKNADLTMLKEGSLKERFIIINAVSAELTAREIEELGRREDVGKIFFDRLSRIPPTESRDPDAKLDGTFMGTNIETVGASYVQNHLNYTGRNVTIAIVDTGVDYTHPDLGGCLGAGCKVLAGYDFVSDDTDPMDDVGHGTHCAGIAAADGGIKGVAPGASILAVKVCNPAGCLDSDTLAGIDWAVGNGADVISLSLGSNYQPSDGFGPVEMACEAAVARGVVVAAAAGNEGPGSGTLSDAASAKDVIGVGADNDAGTADSRDDYVPDFSSKGPAAFGRLKPDVVAPGTSVQATKVGGGYALMTGTSMATPHVAGAAALLIEQNRSISPGQIKAFLMHSAQNISAQTYAKGAGLINVTRAAQTRTEARINGRPLWEESVLPDMDTTAVLNVKNGYASAVNYTLYLEPPTDPEGGQSMGAGLLSYPATLSLAAGEERDVRINFSAQGIGPGTYAGALVLKSSTDNVRIPMALTIPLVGPGTINGRVNDECSIDSPNNCGYDPVDGVEKWGDWIFYELSNVNGTTLDVRLNWSGITNDLDLYLFAPNGLVAGLSGDADSTGEHIIATDLAYPEYWAAVYAYGIEGTSLDYNLTVDYLSSMSIQPLTWQGTLTSSGKISINYTLSNDAAADSGIVAQVVDLKNAEGKALTGSISHTGDNLYYVVWKKSTSGLYLDDARYMNASLTWSNNLNDMDLVFLYKNGMTWNTTRFQSQERNDLSGTGQEDLKGIDIKYYLKYTDIGIGIINPGGTQSYGLKLNFTDESACSYATVTPASIANLPANAERTLQVNLSAGSLTAGRAYDSALVIKEGGREYARVPLRLDVVAGTATSSTTTSSAITITTTTTTMPTTTIASSTTTTLKVEGDADCDGHVNYGDLLILAAAYGKDAGESGYDVRADYNGDGSIGYADLLIIATNYGT